MCYYETNQGMEVIKKANRFVLNETSYHGMGASNEIIAEVSARVFVD